MAPIHRLGHHLVDTHVNNRSLSFYWSQSYEDEWFALDDITCCHVSALCRIATNRLLKALEERPLRKESSSCTNCCQSN